MTLEVVFLGSGGCIRVPSFNCTCRVCEEARKNKTHERTRASIALLGKETTIIDASPDLSAQLEREKIRKIDNIFITHWHFDHVWGLAELVDTAFTSRWARPDVYLPEGSMPFFEKAMGYMSGSVVLHPVNPSDVIETVDASYEVVKTNHTADSVGYIVRSVKSMAYLLDSYIPPHETVEKLSDMDIIVLGPTIDRLVLLEGEERWLHFSLDEAVDFWNQLGAGECILSHMSCHSYIKGNIVAGLTANERAKYEREHDGITFAYDGMRIQL